MTEPLVTVASGRGFQDTLDALVSGLDRRGVPVFARIDHAANAKAAGLELRPTTVVIFGSAKAGTPLMQAQQALGLDLPLRMLVYEDQDGVRIAYREPAAIMQAHGLGPNGMPTVTAMSALLAALAQEAAQA
jgi:uncharacterized protein (DUF302 family)